LPSFALQLSGAVCWAEDYLRSHSWVKARNQATMYTGETALFMLIGEEEKAFDSRGLHSE